MIAGCGGWHNWATEWGFSSVVHPPEPELDGRLFLLLTWSVMDVVGMVPACRPGGQDKLSLTLTRRSREDKAFMACVHLLSGCVYELCTQPLIINRSINHLSIQLTDAFTWKEISSWLVSGRWSIFECVYICQNWKLKSGACISILFWSGHLNLFRVEYLGCFLNLKSQEGS